MARPCWVNAVDSSQVPPWRQSPLSGVTGKRKGLAKRETHRRSAKNFFAALLGVFDARLGFPDCFIGQPYRFRAVTALVGLGRQQFAAGRPEIVKQIGRAS